MERGFCKFFDESHGFGFITNEESKKDIYFHFTGSLDRIKSCDEVEYEIEEGPRGPKAVNIRRIRTNEKR
jgi:cold shock protein